MSSQPAPGRRPRGSRARPLVLSLLAATLAAGCAGGAAPPPGPSGASGPASAPPSAAASPTPTGEAGHTQVPSAPPAMNAPSASAAASPGLPAEPPAATLAGAGGAPVPGALGGYTWGDGGSDAPWIIVRAAGAADGPGPWTIAFEPVLAVTAWTAAWARIRDGAPGPVAGHEVGAGTPLAFVGPAGGGPWTLKVEVRFGDAGQATYFWRLAAR